jgi:hypothetical protein
MFIYNLEHFHLATTTASLFDDLVAIARGHEFKNCDAHSQSQELYRDVIWFSTNPNNFRSIIS